MEKPRIYFSGAIESILLRTLVLQQVEFIKALCCYLVETGLDTQEAIINCLKSSKFFTLSSNSKKTFYQVGGNPVYAALVLAYKKYSCVVYVGILSETDRSKINSIRNFFGDHNIKFNLEVKSTCECRFGSVYTISDSSMLDSPLESYVRVCEVYLKRSLAKRFTRISKNMFIFFDKKLYLVTNLQLKSIPNFVFFQELSVKEDINDIYNELYEILDTKDVDLCEKSRIINRIHLAYCSMDLLCIIECFCSLLYQVALEINDPTENHVLLFKHLSWLIQYEFFLWNVYLIIFRTELSSFSISVFYDCSVVEDFDDTYICLNAIHILRIKNISYIHEAVHKSIKISHENEQETKEILNFLDNEQVEFIEEIHNLLALLPNQIVMHSSLHSFHGKTLLGGIISISVDYMSKTSIRSKAALLLILRHELCHKKWLFKGSGNQFANRTPEYGRDNIQEAGLILDRVLIGHIEEERIFSIDGLTEEVARKILNGIRLSQEELDLLFVTSSDSMIQTKAIKRRFSRNRKYLCTGRISC